MKRTPTEIAMMTPQEAYAAGDADGREALTASMRRDESAAKSIESIEAKLDLDNRILGLERAMKVLAASEFDQANSIADHSRRIRKLEGGKIE